MKKSKTESNKDKLKDMQESTKTTKKKKVSPFTKRSFNCSKCNMHVTLESDEKNVENRKMCYNCGGGKK